MIFDSPVVELKLPGGGGVAFFASVALHVKAVLSQEYQCELQTSGLQTFIILNTTFLVFDTQFLGCNTKFIIFTHGLGIPPAGYCTRSEQKHGSLKHTRKT